MRNAPPLGTLAWLVTRDANKTIGSGMASIELLRRTLERRGWIDDREHGVLNAVARFTPGTNVLAYLAALGWSYHGAAGAAVAVMGGSVPGSVIVTSLTAAAATVDRWRAVRGAQRRDARGGRTRAGERLVARPTPCPRPACDVDAGVDCAGRRALAFARATPVRVCCWRLAIWDRSPRPERAVSLLLLYALLLKAS